MFAGKMPHLEGLSVSFERFGTWKSGEMHMDVFLHLSTFTSVTRLSLTGIIFPSVQTLNRLLSALPSLASLECMWVKFKTHDLRLGASLRRPRNLATLKLGIDGVALRGLSRLLVETEMAYTLKEIVTPWSIPLRKLDESGLNIFRRRLSSFS